MKRMKVKRELSGYLNPLKLTDFALFQLLLTVIRGKLPNLQKLI